jgi:hypothetical protein
VRELAAGTKLAVALSVPDAATLFSDSLHHTQLGEAFSQNYFIVTEQILKTQK